MTHTIRVHRGVQFRQGSQDTFPMDGASTGEQKRLTWQDQGRQGQVWEGCSEQRESQDQSPQRIRAPLEGGPETQWPGLRSGRRSQEARVVGGTCRVLQAMVKPQGQLSFPRKVPLSSV